MLNISNVINVSISQAQTGLGKYNTSNLAIMTSEAPLVAFADGYKIYLSSLDVAVDFGTSSMTYKMALKVFAQNPSILAGGGYLVVIPLTLNEKIDAAITRTAGLVQYFGIITDKVIADADIMTAAALVQTLNKMAIFAKKASTDLDASAICDDLTTAKYDKTRIFLYLTNATTDEASVLATAAYAGRAFSTNFEGNNTTQTMHLKDLVGVNVDAAMTQTLLAKCTQYGADVYASFQGVAKVFTSGANGFFDQVYNRCWFVGALEVAGFNYLAQSSNKIPQTEEGISGLKGAYRKVLEQGVVNQYLAPGSWTIPDTFGNQADFHRNVEERGYYIYSQPVNLQSSVDREARKAPLVQIAAKEAGAVHSSSVVVYINK